MSRRRSDTSEATKAVGRRLRDRRHQLGLRLEDLQDVVEPSHLATIERGEVSPTLDTLENLAAALKTDIRDLMEEGIYQTAKDLKKAQFAVEFAEEMPNLPKATIDAFQKVMEGAVTLAKLSKEKE